MADSGKSLSYHLCVKIMLLNDYIARSHTGLYTHTYQVVWAVLCLELDEHQQAQLQPKL